jgi:parallel beta-helix repeat protein
VRRLLISLGVLGLIAALSPAAAGARTINVSPGQSIQAAVNQANPGDTVSLAPGTYTEAGSPCPSEPGHTCAVVVTKNDISIVGRGASGSVVLQAGADQDEGIAVGKSADPGCLTNDALQVNGSLIRGITVNGFEDDGVFLFCVDGFRVTDVTATDNAEYGIFPSHSLNGRVDHSFVSGANDTGFYIGQSHDARMDHNFATGNVSGYEIENSTRVRADHNEATVNTGGILVFTLPGLDVKSNSNNEVDHNSVHDNNRDNTCTDPSDTVCGVPIGTGILVLAADDNLIHHNDVTGNDSFGIAVANFCTATGTPEEVCGRLDIQPDPDGNRITFNNVTGNGGNPDLARVAAVFAQDLAWDLSGQGNCWEKNVFNTSFPPTLPTCG